MLLSRKYLVLILVSAITLNHVAGATATAAKRSERKNMTESMKGYMSKAMNYAKKMAASLRGGSSENTTGV
ncbi:unnamed protein product [Ixodes pacificus]